MKNMKLIALALFLGLSSSAQATNSQKKAAKLGLVASELVSSAYDFYRYNTDVSALSAPDAKTLDWKSANVFGRGFQFLDHVADFTGRPYLKLRMLSRGGSDIENGLVFLALLPTLASGLASGIFTLKTRRYLHLDYQERVAFIKYRNNHMTADEKAGFARLKKRMRWIANIMPSLRIVAGVAAPIEHRASAVVYGFAKTTYSLLQMYFRKQQVDFIRSILAKARAKGLLDDGGSTEFKPHLPLIHKIQEKVDARRARKAQAVRAEDSADEGFKV